MSDLARLLRETGEAGTRLAETLETTRARCSEAMFELERQLTEALGGDKLRGLPNLTPDLEPGFRAAHLRRRADAAIDDGREYMVLLPEGVFAMARRDGLGGVEHRDYGPSDVLVEDVETAPRAVEAALRAHVAAIANRDQRLGAIRALSDLIFKVFTASAMSK